MGSIKTNQGRIVDSEIIGLISRLYKLNASIHEAILKEAQSIRAEIENQLNELHLIRKQLYETNGISWLPRDYFEDHTSTNQDIEGWNNVLHFLYHPFSKKKKSDEVNLSRK